MENFEYQNYLNQVKEIIQEAEQRLLTSKLANKNSIEF